MFTTEARRAFGRQLVIIFATRTVLNTAHRIIYPFLPTLARGLGISLATASGLVTVRLVAGLTAPLFGPFADQHPRRRVMMAGLLLFALASLLLTGDGLVMAVGAFALFGLAKVVYDPAVHAYLGDSVPYRQRGRAFGIVELSWSAAWLLGVPASGFVMERWGWRAPWAALVVLGLLGALLTRLALPPGKRAAHGTDEGTYLVSLVRRWRSLLGSRRVVVLLFTSLLLAAAQETPFIVYGAWLETAFGLSLGTLGLASVVVGLAEAVAELGTTVFTDRLGKKRSVLLGLLGLAASLVVLPGLARSGLASALVGVVLVTLTFEFAIVSLLPLATELVPDARASLLSLNVTVMSLGRILGAVTGGWLWTWQGDGIAPNAWTGAACALAAALIMAWGMVEVGD